MCVNTTLATRRGILETSETAAWGGCEPLCVCQKAVPKGSDVTTRAGRVDRWPRLQMERGAGLSTACDREHLCTQLSEGCLVRWEQRLSLGCWGWAPAGVTWGSALAWAAAGPEGSPTAEDYSPDNLCVLRTNLIFCGCSPNSLEKQRHHHFMTPASLFCHLLSFITLHILGIPQIFVPTDQDFIILTTSVTKPGKVL